MYEIAALEESLSQGDVIDDCPLITIRIWPPEAGRDVLSETWAIRVVVLTQACDLAQVKTTRVVVAPVDEGTQLVAKNILKAGTIRDQVRRGQVFGLSSRRARADQLGGIDRGPARVAHDRPRHPGVSRRSRQACLPSSDPLA